MEQPRRTLPIAELTVADILDRWPQTVPVFIQHRLACVGCLMSPFEQLKDVSRIYGLEPAAFLEEILQAVSAAEEGETGK